MVLPKAPSPDDQPYIGIEFWATDYGNTMLAELAGNGTVILAQRSASKWQIIFSVPNAPGFKSEPNSVNSIRVNTLKGRVTIYLNGKEVKAIRAQVPTGQMRFGMSAFWVKNLDGRPPIKITNYNVTAGQ